MANFDVAFTETKKYNPSTMKSDLYDAYNNALSFLHTYTFNPKPKGLLKSDIKQVIFNNPATIVYFNDGSKVVVKTMEGDEFNEEIGLAMAIMKKIFGSSTAFKKFTKKWKKTE
jgi:hypothetical protein